MFVVRQYPVNQPRLARLGTRQLHEQLTTAPVVTAVAQVRVRLRSKTAESLTLPGFQGGIVVGTTGSAYAAPVGTPGPANASDPLNAAFKELGYLVDNGLVIRFGREVSYKSSWSSTYPVGYALTGKSITVSFVLKEFNKRAVEFARDVAVTGTNPWASSSANDGAHLRALVLDYEDDAFLFRLYIPEGTLTTGTFSEVSRTRVVDQPVTFESTNSEDPFEWYFADQ